MGDEGAREPRVRLAGEDLTFWWYDSPVQPTTMAMLMVLDRRPDARRLRRAFDRAIAAVPRLAQRVRDAPLDLTLPHWERDPTFDLDYHVRRHALSGRGDLEELFREIAPAYETPFDRSRPLWEARVYEGIEGGRSALFFKLHHAVADGVGGNAIFAALTDAEQDPETDGWAGVAHVPRGAWAPESSLGARVLDAVRDRVALDLERAAAATGTVVDVLRHPEKIGRALEALRSLAASLSFESGSPLKTSVGRARRLSGIALPFAQVRAMRHALGGAMIDVILTIMARAVGRWYATHEMGQVRELMTLVPVNLRKPEEWSDKANVGNVATGILVLLPIAIADPLESFHEIHRRMEEKKADPGSSATPVLAEVLSVLPRGVLTWLAEATFGSVDFIVTNVPGLLVPRYLAGAEILAAYPFAPIAMKSPASVALYGYRDHLFIGLNTDAVVMSDAGVFETLVVEAFEELRDAAGVG